VLQVRPSSAADDPTVCARIVRESPEYFSDDSADRVERALREHDGWVLADGDAVEAFVVVERRPPFAAEVLWMATRPGRRNRGLGTRLLEHVLEELRGDGVRLVEVKTLDRSADYAPYEGTRAFWERRGFVPLDVIDPLPGWQPGNPCAIYVAALGATTPGSSA
jgi:GNAT superfamily N-acetyltransferase